MVTAFSAAGARFPRACIAVDHLAATGVHPLIAYYADN